MSEVVSGYKQIIKVVEDNKIYKKPKPSEEPFSRIQHTMDSLMYSAIYMIMELRKKKKISEKECCDSIYEIGNLHRPYFIRRPDSYYEKIFGKKTVKALREFMATP